MMMLRKIKFVLPFAILFVLFAILWAELSSTRTYAFSFPWSKQEEKIPDFSLPDLFSTNNLTQKDLAGRVVMLNFWASWCSACRAEHAMLMKIKDTYQIPIYGIAFKDEYADAKSYLQRLGNPYTTVAIDSNGSTGVDFGIYATPETFVISPAGNVIYKQVGVIDQETWDNTIYPIIKKYQK